MRKLFVFGYETIQTRLISQILNQVGERWIKKEKEVSWLPMGYSTNNLDIKVKKLRESPYEGSEYIPEADTYIEVDKIDEEVIFLNCYPASSWPIRDYPGVINIRRRKGATSKAVLECLNLNFKDLNFLSDKTKRWFDLVNTYETGFLGGLKDFGAEDYEIQRIQKYDLEAREINPDSASKIISAPTIASTSKRLKVLELNDEKEAVAYRDWMHHHDQLLVITKNNQLLFGGEPEICQKLQDDFSGQCIDTKDGLLSTEKTGLWCTVDCEVSLEEVQDFIEKNLS